ncbi:MAG TPA: tetratricopeptide repeat protein [Polyangia bacterium]
MIARALAVLVVLAAALPARAAPIDDAKKAFAEGKAAFERGDYEQALAAYQRANMILPAPNLYYNIGATYERLGRYQEAALAFDKYFEMAGAATTDEDKDFQEKLRARAEADRKRQDVAPTRQPPPPPPATTQQPYAQQPYAQQPYAQQPYFMPPPGPSREARLKEAHARRTRAIVLMAIGVPMSVVGISVLAWAVAPSVNLTLGEEWGYGFLGFTLGVVGVTLWAPGAASFVKSSHDIKEWSRPEPTTPQPLREVRLKDAKARRTRAIVLMAIGVPMSVVGISVLAWAVAPNTALSLGEEWGYGFIGFTLGVVGVTLWAPGAASFVKSSHDIKEWSRPEPTTPQPLPPPARGF